MSRENFQVYHNAVAHTGYKEMWQYLKEPTPKKPLHELGGEMVLGHSTHDQPARVRLAMHDKSHPPGNKLKFSLWVHV